MPEALANGLALAYETSGDPAAPPMVLVMGLGMPLDYWPDAFVDALAAGGFRVLRFDNRDCGRSQKLASARMPNVFVAMAKAMLGLRVSAPYTLEDMAGDTAGLMDALGIARAHVVGASMGGMIAQALAARHPDRVLSLTSLMSTSGNPRVSLGRPAALRAILRAPPDPDDAEAVAAHLAHVLRVIGSPGYPTEDWVLNAVCLRVARRGYSPEGVLRQLFAIMASGDRRADLVRVRAPTLVIHGAEDPLLRVAASRDIARHIPGARLIEIPGMGHDLPPGLVAPIAAEIVAHCRAAEAAPSAP